MSCSFPPTIKLWLVGALMLCGITSAFALPPSRETLAADLVVERDALLVKIAHGEDYEKSVERFAALWKELKRRQDEIEGLAAQEKAQKKELEGERHQLDHVVGEDCMLSADPVNPPAHMSAFMRGDWGKVIVKQPVRIAAKKPFDDDEQITLYKVQGQRYTYTISSKGPALWYEKPLVANVGDLVLVCYVSVQSEGSGSAYPPEFREHIMSQGFAVPIKEPPSIVKLAAKNPAHFIGRENRFIVAIHRGEWSIPPEIPILSRVLVKSDLGMAGTVHRFAMFASDRDEFVLEVPPTLRNIELLKPYRYAWVLMGKHRFDRELKRLVLVAEQIDERYVTPKN